MKQVGIKAVVALACAWLGAAAPATAANAEIGTIGNSFSPANVTINVGNSVHWSGLLGGFHTVAQVDNASAAIWNGGFHSAGAANEFTFSFVATGIYYYICEPHVGSGMRGTVTVIEPVPTVSGWSLIVMTVLAFTAGTILFGRRRRAAAA